MSRASVDLADITILGWTPTHDQLVAIVAVLAGAAAVVVLMGAFRKTRRVVLALAIAAVVAVVWAWLHR